MIQLTQEEYDELKSYKDKYEMICSTNAAVIPKWDYERLVTISGKYTNIREKIENLLQSAYKHQISLIDNTAIKKLEELLK